MAKCGAKTRSGAPCEMVAMKNGRCKMHGGKSTGPPKGTQNALKHGIYAQYLTPAERETYHELTLGSVDDELRLTKIRLARALAAEAKAAGAAELEQVVENFGQGAPIPDKTKTSKVKDYTAIIDRLTARIESLERTRRILDGGAGDNDDVTELEVIPYDDEG